MSSVLQMAYSWAGQLARSVAQPRAETDGDLIARFLRSDDENAFEVLVRRYQDRVFRLAKSILGRGAESEAEDVTQEIFVALYRTLHTFRQECAFSTWLYRLARNKIIDCRRSQMRRWSVAVEEAPESLPDVGLSMDPLSAADAEQQRRQLQRSIDRLPQLQRAVVRLFYWQGQTIAEIGELLELNPNTVKSHLFRARLSLGRLLREEEFVDRV